MVTCKGHLADTFRIFINPRFLSNLLALHLPPAGHNPICQKISLYTDGACLNNGKENAACGSRIWAGHRNYLNKSIRVPSPAQSNQVGEIAAIIVAVTSVPISQPLEIISDSKYAIEGLMTYLQSWEDQGWIGIKNTPFFQKAAHLLHRRTATTTFKWVKGHEGIEGNELSDRLAKEGATKPLLDKLDLSVPDNFNIQGAKLASLTQATTYRGIRRSKPHPDRPTSSENIQTMKEAIEHYTRNAKTEETIWMSIRKPPIHPKISQFLFRVIHSMYKLGIFWTRMEAVADCSLCTTCNMLESMDHILTQCHSLPTQLIWQLAKETWPHTNFPWPEITLGTILGSGCLSVPQIINQEQNKNKTHHCGATHLLQILLTKSAYQIWVLCCKRVIHDKPHNRQEIHQRWLCAINTRLTKDKVTATNIKRNKGFTNLVVNTWEHVLAKERVLPNSWINTCEVLVGSGA